MFCKNCGSTIDDNAVVCPNCGTQVGTFPTAQKTNTSGSNTIAIVGFVFAFISPLIGLICSILGYRKAASEGLPYKTLALAGIIISAAYMVVMFILMLILVPVILAALSEMEGMSLLLAVL